MAHRFPQRQCEGRGGLSRPRMRETHITICCAVDAWPSCCASSFHHLACGCALQRSLRSVVQEGVFLSCLSLVCRWFVYLVAIATIIGLIVWIGSSKNNYNQLSFIFGLSHVSVYLSGVLETRRRSPVPGTRKVVPGYASPIRPSTSSVSLQRPSSQDSRAAHPTNPPFHHN